MSHTEFVAAGAGAYVEWGWFSVGVTNLAIIGVMLAVFALAPVVPFGHHADLPEDGADADEGRMP